MYIAFFDQFDIYFIIETIKTMFSKTFVWHLDDIKEYIQQLEPLVTDEAIYTTLKHIVDNKVFIVDTYGREGFIIQSGNYYIFNDSDIDIESSIYSKILDFSVDVNKYSLKEFSENTLKTNPFSKQLGKEKSTSDEPNEIDLLTQEDLDFNTEIEINYPIYGTYRTKKGKADKWEHKYGKRDEKFRILDLRNITTKNRDQRRDVTGKAAESYEISDLRSIARALDIEVNDTHQKSDLIRLIKRLLESQNRILR